MSSQRQFNFSVDSKHYRTEEQRLSGARIKQLAGVGPNFSLFLETHGSGADHQVSDSELIDFAVPGRETFYTAPPATFGCVTIQQ